MPVQGECLSQSLVYRAHVTNNKDNSHANYIALTVHSFKDRLHKTKRNYDTETKWLQQNFQNIFENYESSNRPPYGDQREAATLNIQ